MTAQNTDGLTLPRIVAAAVEQFAENTAIIDCGRSWTFAQLQAESRQASKAVIAAGIKPGDRVAIWAPNMAEWIIAAIGLENAGGVLVPLNNRLHGPEAADIIKDSGARMLFTFAQMEKGNVLDMMGAAELPNLERIVLLQGEDPRAQSWEDFLKSGNEVDDLTVDHRADAIDADTVMDMLFTSGTTGKAKGVMCTHGQNSRAFRTWAETVGLRPDDVYLGVNPFFHSFGYKAGWFACLITGCTMVPVRAFDRDRVLGMIQEHKITTWPGAPALYEMILNFPGRKDYDLSSLRLGVTGAAPVSVELVEAMWSDLGFETVVTAYGLTETCGLVSICRPDDSAETISRTSGCAIDGVEVQIVSPATLQEVPRGEEGEIWVRGFNVMKGYFNLPEATAETITQNGWLRTGDIGIMDDRGYLRITDRLKDMYIMNGENVYPAEVEKVIAAMDGVAQVAVIGVPRKQQGEVGHAFVVLAPGATLSQDAVVNWCSDRLARYKVPFAVQFVDALPMNAMNKVLKPELRKLAAAHG